MDNTATRAVVTELGRRLAAKLMTAGSSLQFTAASLGDGDLPVGMDPVDMTGLAHYVMDASLTDIGTVVNGIIPVSLQVLPGDVQAAFFAKEAALYALDPDAGEITYAYITMHDDPTELKPPENNVGKMLLLDISVLVYNVMNVTAELSTSMLVTIQKYTAEMARKADLDPATDKLKLEQMPDGVPLGDIDCGFFDDGGVDEHDMSPYAHPLMLVDGNADTADTSQSLEEHMENPLAHQNLVIDGNGS